MATKSPQSENTFTYVACSGHTITEDFSPKRIEQLLEEERKSREIRYIKEAIKKDKKDLELRRKYVIVLEANDRKERVKKEKLVRNKLLETNRTSNFMDEIRKASVGQSINSDK